MCRRVGTSIGKQKIALAKRKMTLLFGRNIYLAVVHHVTMGPNYPS